VSGYVETGNSVRSEVLSEFVDGIKEKVSGGDTPAARTAPHEGQDGALRDTSGAFGTAETRRKAAPQPWYI
jgi:hypothetical protein